MRIKQIIGYDHYLVTDEGQVISIRYEKRKVLKHHIHSKGYPQVSLWKNKRQRTFWVHRLVLETFVGPRAEGEVCMHLDGNPANNRLENIRWGTPKENAQQMVRDGNGRKSAFTSEALHLMKTMAGTQADVARRFGVTSSYISLLRSGKRGV